jgi:hypothetical protein
MKLTVVLHIVLRIKTKWRYAATPPYAPTVWRLITAQGQLYLYIEQDAFLRKQKHEALQA